MRVVVTGGSGKAGQWVVRLLAEAGHEVVNFDVVNRPELELPGQFCRVELENAGKVYDALFQYRPDAVCHLAANPAPGGQAQIDVFDNNVRSAYNLMQAAGDLGEPDEVAEDHRDIVVSISNQLLASVEPIDDRLGEHVQQELV